MQPRQDPSCRRWLLLITLAFVVACASTGPSTAPRTASPSGEAQPGEFSILFSDQKPGPLRDALATHAKCYVITAKMGNSLFKTHDAFASEIVCVESTLVEGLKKQPGPLDPSFEGLVAAHDAGYINEYVLVNYHNPEWKVPLLPRAKPDDRKFDIAGYWAWAVKNLQGRGTPALPFVIHEGSPRHVENAMPRTVPQHPRQAEVKRAYDAVLAGGDCAPHRDLLESVAGSWPREKERLATNEPVLQSSSGERVAVVPRGRGRVVAFSRLPEYFEYLASIPVDREAQPIPILASTTIAQATEGALVCANRSGSSPRRWLEYAVDMNPVFEESARSIRATAEAASEAPECPSRDTDPAPRCAEATPPTYGHRPEEPLEIGTAGAGTVLWFDRLLCASGAKPDVRRIGAAGHPVTPSRATGSLALGAAGATSELLDRWEVRCPGEAEPRTLYTNMYRCGLICPPPPFRVLSSATQRRLGESDARRRDQKWAAALAFLDDVPELEQGLEPVLLQRARALASVGRHQDAEAAYGRALALDRDDVDARLGQAKAKRELGDEAFYARVVVELAASVSADHDLYAEIQCAAGLALRKGGRVGEGEAKVEEACAEGYVPCCSLRQRESAKE